MRTSSGLVRRPLIRLAGFDYRSRVVYVTINASGRRCLFGDVINGEMRLSTEGEILAEEWLATPLIRPGVIVDEYQVMPNHFHGILYLPRIPSEMEDLSAPRRPRSLGSTIGGLKGKVTSRIRDFRNMDTLRVWQDGFYDEVIRDQQHLERCRQYIRDNPANRLDDVDYVATR